MKKIIFILLIGISFTASAQDFCKFTTKDGNGNKALIYESIMYSTIKINYNGTTISSFTYNEINSITTTLVNSKYVLEISSAKDKEGKSIEIPIDKILYLTCDVLSKTITIVIN
ncbi:MAG TPA: hypothetical protein PKK00_04525 [Bacteroidales bacterium]|nr:hypothetical protein [Bacteroidales bacterium]HPS16676.1 hypothetical protein [Bacteroidales bacterium]